MFNQITELLDYVDRNMQDYNNPNLLYIEVLNSICDTIEEYKINIVHLYYSLNKVYNTKMLTLLFRVFTDEVEINSLKNNYFKIIAKDICINNDIDYDKFVFNNTNYYFSEYLLLSIRNQVSSDDCIIDYNYKEYIIFIIKRAIILKYIKINGYAFQFLQLDDYKNDVFNIYRIIRNNNKFHFLSDKQLKAHKQLFIKVIYKAPLQTIEKIRHYNSKDKFFDDKIFEGAFMYQKIDTEGV